MDEPRQKHETRNPVDIQMVLAKSTAHIGEAYKVNQEAKRERAAAESENKTLRSAILSLDKIIADQSQEIANLEALVNEKANIVALMLIVIFTLSALVFALCFML
jgi:hypothetical protein